LASPPRDKRARLAPSAASKARRSRATTATDASASPLSITVVGLGELPKISRNTGRIPVFRARRTPLRFASRRGWHTRNMSRTAIALAAVVAAALALVLSGVGTGGGSSQRASLRFAQTVPLHIAGSHFRAHERVRVTATVSAASSTRRVRASGRGSFVAVFTTGASRCSEVRVIAVGGGGSRATLKRLPSPACLPA
jgi:hypothetical protein